MAPAERHLRAHAGRRDRRRIHRSTRSLSRTRASAWPPRSSTSTASRWQYEPTTFPHRVGRQGQRHRLVHARLLPARLRPLHRADDDEPEARDQEEPQGQTPQGALPRRQHQDLLPEGLPRASRSIRRRVDAGRARRRRRASCRATEADRHDGGSAREPQPLPAESATACLLDEAAIQQRVAELGAQITEDFAGEDLRLVTVLKGGLFFLADLCRAIDLPLSDRLHGGLAVRAWVSGATVRVTKDLSDDIAGASVLLVEDVVDTGLTVNYVLSLLRAHGPARLEVCTLLDKPARRIADVPIAYRGFELPDRFLVGYGLDLDGRYRNLPYVAVARDEAVLP